MFNCRKEFEKYILDDGITTEKDLVMDKNYYKNKNIQRIYHTWANAWRACLDSNG